jgi:hypothetical protein
MPSAVMFRSLTDFRDHRTTSTMAFRGDHTQCRNGKSATLNDRVSGEIFRYDTVRHAGTWYTPTVFVYNKFFEKLLGLPNNYQR